MSRIELVASCILYRKQWADTAFWRTQIWWTTCRSCRFWWVEPPTLWQTWPLMAPCALESLGIAWNVGDFGGCEKACSDCSAAKSRSSDFMCATVKTCQDIIYWVLCSHLTVIRLVVGRLPLSVGEWPCPFVGEHTYSRKVRCVISLGGSSSMVLCLLRFNIIVVFYMSWTSSLIEPSVAVVFFGQPGSCMDFLSVANTSILLHQNGPLFGYRLISYYRSRPCIICICSGSMICHCQNLNAQ